MPKALLDKLAAKKSEFLHPGLPPSFDVRLVSPLMSAGSYRVFVERNDVIFIQLEGGKASVLAALAPFLGPAGNVIPLLLWLSNKRSKKAKQKELENASVDELLRDNEGNFKLYTAEIREAAIEPPSTLAMGGKAGRLVLSVRYGERYKCEFGEVAQMKQAIRLLTPVLPSTLKINVDWNEQKGEFEKKKKERGPTHSTVRN